MCVWLPDKLPPREYWPSDDDLRKAEKCFNSVSLEMMPNQVNFYIAKYYRTLCDLHIWKRQYPEAMRYLEKARKLYDQVKLNPKVQPTVDQRFQLLEALNGDDKIGEILKEYFHTDIV